MFAIGDHVVYHGAVQAGGEWLATVDTPFVVEESNEPVAYLIKFRDATMRVVSPRDIESWDGPEYEGESWDSALPLD
jgi:hypothetical protein